MPSWVVASSYGAGLPRAVSGSTNCPAFGDLNYVSYGIKMHGSYTWSGLSVYVPTNAINASSTFKSYAGAGVGAQVCTIPALTTGLFQDTTHSDSLVSGDIITTFLTTGSASNIILSFWSSLLTAATDIPILAATYAGSLGAGLTVYYPVGGRLFGNATEDWAKYKVYANTVLSNLRVYAYTNTSTTNATIRLRVDKANVNQTVTITALTTGAFEDAANTDTVTAGKTINYIGSGATVGAVSIDSIQMKSESTARQLIGSTNSESGFNTGGACVYEFCEGDPASTNAVEVKQNVPILAALTFKKAYCWVKTNSGTACTYRSRKNGGYGNILITITSGTTGAFEDVANSDNTVSTDKYTWEWGYTTFGSLAIMKLGIEEYQPSAPSASLKSGSMASKLVAAGVL